MIPFGPVVSIFGHQSPLQLTDFPVAVLYVLAIASTGIYGIVLAGWSSGSTYPLLGGLRSSAQMISYEIAMSLSFVAVFLYSGSMSTSQIVTAQQHFWYIVLLLPSFLIYATSMVGETNRAPFDLPEAEGELVGGFHTEYSSLKFALFFLAEYINMVTVSAMATTLFLGGWRIPYPLSAIDHGLLNTGWYPMLWWLVKVCLFIFVFIWLRGTLPRLRYDQFMQFGWKLLIPASIGWIVIVASVRAFRNEYSSSSRSLIIWVAAAFVVVMAVSYFWSAFVDNKRVADEFDDDDEDEADELSPFAGGFPVPPMPGQTFKEHARVGEVLFVTANSTPDEEATDG